MKNPLTEIYKYSLKEVKKQLHDLNQLYDVEVDASIKKSDTIKRYKDKLQEEHMEKMRLVVMLALAAHHVDDEKIREKINDMLKKYLEDGTEIKDEEAESFADS